MRQSLSLLLALSLFFVDIQNANAQSFNSENNELASFLTRMYRNNPFEGVRIVKDYDNTYLLSVVSIEKAKYPQQSIMNRVASVKAMSEANRFFNGSDISSDIIIQTTEHPDGNIESEITEEIRERSFGTIKEMQQLTVFPDGSNQIFMYFTTINQAL